MCIFGNTCKWCIISNLIISCLTKTENITKNIELKDENGRAKKNYVQHAEKFTPHQMHQHTENQNTIIWLNTVEKLSKIL